jgi:hypothetical protein
MHLGSIAREHASVVTRGGRASSEGLPEGLPEGHPRAPALKGQQK